MITDTVNRFRVKSHENAHDQKILEVLWSKRGLETPIVFLKLGSASKTPRQSWSPTPSTGFKSSDIRRGLIEKSLKFHEVNVAHLPHFWCFHCSRRSGSISGCGFTCWRSWRPWRSWGTWRRSKFKKNYGGFQAPFFSYNFDHFTFGCLLHPVASGLEALKVTRTKIVEIHWRILGPLTPYPVLTQNKKISPKKSRD